MVGTPASGWHHFRHSPGLGEAGEKKGRWKESPGSLDQGPMVHGLCAAALVHGHSQGLPLLNGLVRVQLREAEHAVSRVKATSWDG